MRDAYLNTLLGVDYYDKFRFKLIDERKIYEKIKMLNGVKAKNLEREIKLL